MNTISVLNNIERSESVKKLYVNDIWYYPIVKQHLIVPYLVKEYDQFTSKKINKFQIAQQLTDNLKWEMKNKRIKKCDFFIHEHPNSRVLFNKKYYSRWCDFISEVFPEKKIFFYEKPDVTRPSHFTSAFTKEIYYSDLDITKLLIKAKFKKKNLRINKKFLKDFLSENQLNIKTDEVYILLNKFFHYIDYYKKLINKISPEISFINTSYVYTNMALIYVCNINNIATVEMQHGHIGSEHTGYIYKNVENKELFPQYFFSFGNYFSSLLKEESVIFNNDKILNTGYFYIEKIKNSKVQVPEIILKRIQNKKVILITSQWTVCEQLKKFVLQISNMLDNSYIIIYKPHPRELEPEKYYQIFFKINNIITILDNSVSSLELMKISDIHVTVFSTSFYEATFLGLNNIFIEVKPYSNSVYKFIDHLVNHLCNTPESFIEVIKTIERDKKKSNKSIHTFASEFFKEGAMTNFRNNIETILNKK